MSSKHVRAKFMEEVAKVDLTVKALDLTMLFDDLDDFLKDENIDQLEDGWIGVQFLSASETPIDILATNDQGTYREEGDVFVHVTYPSVGGYEKIMILAEKIRSYFRGKRFGDIIIDRVDPPQFGMGVALNFEAGLTSAVVSIGYQRDLVLS